MLELIFQGFLEWTYGLILECWEYFSSVLFDLMSLDFAYLETHMPIITTIRQIMLGVGWALLLGNLVFQATRSMMAGVGFEADDPKLLFTRTFVFSFLLVASPQICDVCLNMTSVIIDMVQMPDAASIKLPDESTFAGMAVSWLLVIICGLTVSRSSHVQAGAQQHTATYAFESRYSRNTGPARSTVAEKTMRPAPASANTPTKAPRSSTIPQERSTAPSTVSTGQRSGVRPDTAGMSHSTRRPTVSPTRNTQSAPKQTPRIPTPVKQPTVSGRSAPKDAKSSKRAGKKKDDSHAG